MNVENIEVIDPVFVFEQAEFRESTTLEKLIKAIEDSGEFVYNKTAVLRMLKDLQIEMNQ